MTDSISVEQLERYSLTALNVPMPARFLVQPLEMDAGVHIIHFHPFWHKIL